MKHKSWLLLLALAGCSVAGVAPTDASPDGSAADAADALPPDARVDAAPADAPADATTDIIADAATDTAPDAASDGATDTGSAGRLVINEISAAGDEWVELFNAGSAPVDLSDLQVADSESDGGARLSRAIRFPAGTTLAPGQYALVLANQADAGAGPQTACLDGGPATCFHAGWSLSASRGETVWVLSPSGSVVLSALYPMNATVAPNTWGRLPNGTGDFAVSRPTPAASNAAP